MFKTRLDTFENDFGQFWNFEDFLIILKTFEKPDPPWNTGQNYNRQNCHKTCSKRVGQFWQRFWAFLQFWNVVDFFKHFRWLHGTLGKKTFSKNSPQNTFGHLETFLDNFRTLKLFWFFPLIFSKSLHQNLSPENWTQIFKSWKLISYFWIRESELTILSPEHLKWNCVYWLWRECKKNAC